MSLPDKQVYSALGGELQDYSQVEDPTTDLAAAASDEARADTAAMTRTCGRCYVVFSISGTTCTVVDHDSVWGNDISVKPTINYNGIGDYTCKFPDTVTDARGITHAVNLRWAIASVEGTSFAAGAKRLDATHIEVFTTSIPGGGVPADPGANVVVFVW